MAQELNAEDILGIDDRDLVPVTVPEWGDAVIHVRTMGAMERAKYEASLVENKDGDLGSRMAEAKIRLVLLCACDGGGARLFDDSQFDQLAAKNGNAIDRLFEAINKLNALSDDEIEDIAGN